tara:strand:+ start:9478 stop:9729 length:252 start_codon:yes stop_codon:yes gene_type:complete
MGGLFSSPKAPAPAPAQEARISRQEARANAEEITAKRKVQARAKAKSTGGSRMLMAKGVYGNADGEERQVTNTTLGAGRNPRG